MASHWNTAVLPAVVRMSTGRSTKLGGTEHIQMVIYRLLSYFSTLISTRTISFIIISLIFITSISRIGPTIFEIVTCMKWAHILQNTSLPCTVSRADAEITPSEFSATHRYSPWSSPLTLTMCRPPLMMLMRDVSRSARPFRDHVISGWGEPVAEQGMSTLSPCAALTSFGRVKNRGATVIQSFLDTSCYGQLCKKMHPYRCQ